MAQKDLVKKFDTLFKTQFSKKEENELQTLINSKKDILNITNLTSNNYLLILIYLYLESKDFLIEKNEIIEKKDTKLEDNLKKLFRKPLVCTFQKNGDILIVTKKKEKGVSYVDPFKNVAEYKGSDIIYYNKNKGRITYTKGDADRKIKALVKEKKVSFIISNPKEIEFSPIKKILSSKKIDIFEIEFRSVNLEKIKGFYIKAGSKEEKINTKINLIIGKLLDKKILRVSNIKKIHLSLRRASRDRSASLIITSPKKLGIFKIKWKGIPPSELDNFIKKEILKDLFNVELVDKEVPLIERILEFYLNKEISEKELNQNKAKIKEWDKYNLLEYRNNRLNPNYANFENLLESELEKDYTILKSKIEISKKLIKEGYLLKRKVDSKEIFIYLNKRELKEDVKRLLNKRLPILIIDYRENCSEEKYRYNFLMTNEKGIKDLIDIINQICSHPEFYKDINSNFISSKNYLQNIKSSLNQIKDNQEKGAKWEEVCFDILNFIFHRTFSLSGPSLPDGLTFWTESNNGFLWDCKALFTKKLKDSIKGKTKKPKDLAYLEVFKKKLQIDYYIFLTCGINEYNFNNAKKILEEYKSNVHFCGLTDNAMLDLCKIFEDLNNAIMLHKNLDKFTTNFKKILDKGYVDKISFKDVSEGINENITLDKKNLRKEIKKEEDVE